MLTQLRAATQPQHDALELLGLSQRLTDGSLDAAGYRQIIRWQHLAHSTAEIKLAEFEWPAGYSYRPRLPTLSSELELLAPGEPEVESLPRLAALTTLAQATGRAYVFEGSALGGNVILGHLLRNSLVAEFAPFPLYAFQREHGINQWRSFTAFAKTHTWSPTQITEAVAAAQQVFEVFAEAGNTIKAATQ